MTTRDEEITAATIGDKLTPEEYEWFATHEWSIGVETGRRQMLDTVLAFLKTYTGELFSEENDSDAEFVRDLRKLIMDKVKP